MCIIKAKQDQGYTGKKSFKNKEIPSAQLKNFYTLDNTQTFS